MPFSIVGARFRPPALAILSTLPSGTRLWARAEPDNPFDPNAVAVFVDSSEIPHTAHAELDLKAKGYGSCIEAILAQSEWHLGYIPKNIAVLLQPRLKVDGEFRDQEGTLSFSMKGAPCISLPKSEDLEALA